MWLSACNNHPENAQLQERCFGLYDGVAAGQATGCDGFLEWKLAARHLGNSVLASLGSVVESSKQFRCLYRAFILLNQIATAFMLPSWADICKFEGFPH